MFPAVTRSLQLTGRTQLSRLNTGTPSLQAYLLTLTITQLLLSLFFGQILEIARTLRSSFRQIQRLGSSLSELFHFSNSCDTGRVVWTWWWTGLLTGFLVLLLALLDDSLDCRHLPGLLTLQPLLPLLHGVLMPSGRVDLRCFLSNESLSLVIPSA